MLWPAERVVAIADGGAAPVERRVGGAGASIAEGALHVAGGRKPGAAQPLEKPRRSLADEFRGVSGIALAGRAVALVHAPAGVEFFHVAARGIQDQQPRR